MKERGQLQSRKHQTCSILLPHFFIYLSFPNSDPISFTRMSSQQQAQPMGKPEQPYNPNYPQGEQGYNANAPKQIQMDVSRTTTWRSTRVNPAVEPRPPLHHRLLPPSFGRVHAHGRLRQRVHHRSRPLLSLLDSRFHL